MPPPVYQRFQLHVPAKRLPVNRGAKQNINAALAMGERMAITAFFNTVPRTVGKDRAPRRQLRLPLQGSKAGGGEVEALVHNISATGMLIESHAPLEIGEVIEVNLPHSGKTAAKLIWVSGRLAGCEFAMPVSSATLSAAQLRGVVVESEPDTAENRPSSSAESFGTRLQRLRTAKGLTQGQLAAELGVSEPSISAWELDKARPKAGRVEVLANELGVEIHELLGLEEIESLSDLVTRAKEQIAKAAGVAPANIKLTIEI